MKDGFLLADSKLEWALVLKHLKNVSKSIMSMMQDH